MDMQNKYNLGWTISQMILNTIDAFKKGLKQHKSIMQTGELIFL